MFGPVAAIVGGGLMLGGTIASMNAQNKAAKAQQKQFAYQRQLNDYKSAQDKRNAIRAARLSQGTAEQVSANQGAMSTDASLGGIGSIQSQLDQNLSFLDTTKGLQDAASVQAGKAVKQENNAAIFSAIAGIGEKIFSAGGAPSGG